MTNREQRFIRYWDEQKQGGKWSYVLLYTAVGTFMLSLVFSVMLLLFYNIYPGAPAFWMIPSAAFLLSLVYSISSWKINEKKWSMINDRHVIESDQIKNVK